MPPLISLHMHLALTDGLANSATNFNEENIRSKLNQYARYGVLHVTSMGTDQMLVDTIRMRQAAGEIPGARLYTAGRGFGVGNGGYPPEQPNATPESDVHRLTSVDEVPAAVAELAERDVNFVKVWVDEHFGTRPPFDTTIYQAIVRQALDAGMRPVAHIHTYRDAERLIDAGVVGIVHSVRDRPVDDALIQKYLAGNVFSVSTLAREESMFIYAGRAPYLDDPFFTAYLEPKIIATLESPEFQATHINNPELGEWEPALNTAQQNLMALFDAGVKIGFGSDSGPPARFEGYFEHREMAVLF
jgi:imidazolonepropionase-like amidohydrolase